MATVEIATVDSGNTTPSSVPVIKSTGKARDWLLTLNEPNRFDELWAYLTGRKNCLYAVACKENAPTTGHEHMHIFVQYNVPVQLSIKKCCGAHIDRCRGTPQQCDNYVRKDGVIIAEFGDIHRHGGSIKTVAELRECSYEECPAMLYNIKRKIHEHDCGRVKIDEWYKPDLKVYYIYGPSGIGKSTRAAEIMRENGVNEFDEVFYEGSFWHGVSNDCTACLYDDFRAGHMKPSEFVRFIDYNTHMLNVKGSSIRNHYKLIVITSVQDPNVIYANVGDEPRKQWLRRLNLIDMNPPSDEVTESNVDQWY